MFIYSAREEEIMDEQQVIVVDDDEAVCDAICELAASVGLNARGYTGAEAFLAEFSLAQRCCLIIDIRMAGMSGIALQRHLGEMGATQPIIFITAYGDVMTAVEAMKAGAFDFIEKPYREQHLLDSINAALAYERQQYGSDSERLAMSQGLDALTRREQEVMQLLLAGETTRELAASLNISPRTVEVHRQRVLRKLGCRSVAELAARMG